MTTHPNRSRQAVGTGTNPTPLQVLEAREAAGLSQAKAAAVIYATTRTWEGWEAAEDSQGHRRMPPGMFELFLFKTGRRARILRLVVEQKIKEGEKFIARADEPDATDAQVRAAVLIAQDVAVLREVLPLFQPSKGATHG
jgi:hypothetical protein